MPLSRRFSPEHSAGDSALYGMDFSFILSANAVINSAAISVYPNTFMPAGPSSDWAIGPVTIDGTIVYARLSGGTEGVDNQIRFRIEDSDGNTWNRTALVLVAQTS